MHVYRFAVCRYTGVYIDGMSTMHAAQAHIHIATG